MQKLEPLHFPLWGSRLMEASAGTGKTWTIAALYVRLVLGHGQPDSRFVRPLAPAEILVMTFTRAATRELSARIRQRLLEAARYFRHPEDVSSDADDFLRNLLADYPDPHSRQQAAWQLANAAENMDDCAVFTIDAWCQRMLREHAFDSGSVFDENLVADEQSVMTAAVQDYWRQECYPLTNGPLEAVLSVWPSVHSLAQEVRALLQQPVPLPPLPPEVQGGTLHHVVSNLLPPALQNLLQQRQQHIPAMQNWLLAQLAQQRKHWNATTLKTESVAKWFAQLQTWASNPLPLALPKEEALYKLTQHGLQATRKKEAPAIDIPSEFAWFSEVFAAYQSLPNPATPMRLHAAHSVQRRIEQLKRQAGEFGFQDLLQRLHAALQGSDGQRLRQRILAQYPLALIDEFQDTSPLQYAVFDQLYGVASNPAQQALLLIGDPKQSIYGFRGADIYSYLRARSATGQRHYALDTNYRSTKDLVTAVNRLFLHAEKNPSSHPKGAFLFRSAGPTANNDSSHSGGSDGGSRLPFVEVQAQGRSERLHIAGLPAAAALTIVHDVGQVQDTDTLRWRFAVQCAEQVVAWLADAQTGLLDADGHFTRLRPADIAILVRTGKEAAVVRRALQQRRVASVYLSERDSVFHGNEAQDLLHWLRGVAMPQDAALVRAALATRTVGLSIDELAWYTSHDEAFDVYCDQMRQLRQVWSQQGVLAMLRQSLQRLGWAARWLAAPEGDGERRLTNFLHLAELLHSASTDLDGEQALIRWLELKISAPAQDSDEQLLRLESDADLVKVVTIHKSKGLEYPLVLLPFAFDFRAVSGRDQFATVPDAQGTPQLVLELSDETRQVAEQERLREDLRLLYVALTRARHALWVGFATIKKGNSPRCQSHLSALGYLLGGPKERAASDWLPVLQAVAGGPLLLQAATPAEQALPCSLLPALTQPADLADHLPDYVADFDRTWSVSSYSRLTRVVYGSARTTLAARRAQDEWSADAPTSTTISTISTPVGEQAIAHRFKPGALSGNFLHEQLEWLAAGHFALQDAQARQKALLARCERAGHSAEEAAELLQWLQQVVQTPLPQLCAPLAGLEGALVPEMEFWLPAQAINTTVLDGLCQQHIFSHLQRPQLQSSQLHGMLMGFADLVFCHGGRYWVLDYKSSRLGQQDADYSRAAMQEEMVLRRYDVQAILYQFALHRLLQQRLGTAYQPEEHLGGALYFFIRGIAGPEQGICWVPPSIDCLQGMQAMFGGDRS